MNGSGVMKLTSQKRLTCKAYFQITKLWGIKQLRTNSRILNLSENKVCISNYTWNVRKKLSVTTTQSDNQVCKLKYYIIFKTWLRPIKSSNAGSYKIVLKNIFWIDFEIFLQ